VGHHLVVLLRRLFFRLRRREPLAATWEDADEQIQLVHGPKGRASGNRIRERATGHAPQSITVVLSGETLVITLHGVLSQAEKALAKSPAGATQVQEFHRQLFLTSSDALRDEIKKITGAEVREATAEIEPKCGTVVKAFTTGTMVQVFLLAHGVAAEFWSGSELDGHS
jgi:uncharacterized protein YbcI